MGSDPRRRSFANPDDEWLPSPWIREPEPPVRRPQREPQLANRVARTTVERQATQATGRTGRDAVRLAVAPFVGGAASLLLWILGIPSVVGVPAGLILVAAVLTAGGVLTRSEERPYELHAPWIVHLAATIGFLPLIAIQVSILREPYVSLSANSARPAIVVTLVTIGFLFVLAAATVFRFWRRPNHAAFVILPAVLLIPLAMGEPEELRASSALLLLGTSMLVGGAVTAITELVPRPFRLLAPPLTLGATIVVLWLAGRGPVLQETSGDIVRVLYFVLLAAAIAVVVVMPLVATRLERSPKPAGERPTTRRARRNPVRNAAPRPRHSDRLSPRVRSDRSGWE